MGVLIYSWGIVKFYVQSFVNLFTALGDHKWNCQIILDFEENK